MVEELIEYRKDTISGQDAAFLFTCLKEMESFIQVLHTVVSAALASS